MASLPLHHVGRTWPWGPRFDNPWDSWEGDKSLSDGLGLVKEVRALGAPSYGYLSTNRQPSLDDFRLAFPLHKPDAGQLGHPPDGGVQATWVGHASVLVQMEGLTFITDPVFSERCSPFQFLGPRRVVPPALTPEDAALPALDFVLISHNHYDHLDVGSVRRLFKRFGPQLAWYVPLGLKPWFSALGITNVTELDWWQEQHLSGSKVRLVLTPAQHWSARGLMDRRATLWGGWAVLGRECRFWFAGDSGYCPVFKEIGQRLGPFDLAAIPVGAYEPRWFMRTQHINAEEAVEVAQDVRAAAAIGVHCCTFSLTTEPLDEPPTRLAAEVARRGLAPGSFVVLQHGATLAAGPGGKLLNNPPVLGHSHGSIPA